MPNFLYVIGKITLKKPCVGDLNLPAFGVSDTIQFEADCTGTVFAGGATYRMTATLRVFNRATCAETFFVSSGGNISPGTPRTETLTRTWDTANKPAGIYETRVTIECEKQLANGQYEAKELVALETCLFKVGSPTEVGITAAITSMNPCDATVATGTIPFNDKCKVKVLASDPDRYEAKSVAEIWDIGTDTMLKDVEAVDSLDAGESADQNNAGSFVRATEMEGLNVYKMTTKVLNVPSSSSSGGADPCDSFRQLFFRTCRFSVTAASSSSSSSSSP